MRMALIIAAVLGAAFVVATFHRVFATDRPELLRSDHLFRVPVVCVPLAQRFDIPLEVTRTMALEVKVQLHRYRIWPGVRACLAAINREWRF